MRISVFSGESGAVGAVYIVGMICIIGIVYIVGMIHIIVTIYIIGGVGAVDITDIIYFLKLSTCEDLTKK